MSAGQATLIYTRLNSFGRGPEGHVHENHLQRSVWGVVLKLSSLWLDLRSIFRFQ